MKKIINGKVSKISGDKTIKIRFLRIKKHKKYHKQIKIYKNFMVHDELCKFKVGDEVKAIECKPISKNKFFKVIYD